MGKAAHASNEETAAGMTGGKRLNVEVRTIEEGMNFTGIYVGRTTRNWIDKASGQEKPLTAVVFQELTSEDRFSVWEDAGLKNVLDGAFVKEGMKLRIHKLEKKDLAGGRTVNQYDIYAI